MDWGNQPIIWLLKPATIVIYTPTTDTTYFKTNDGFKILFNRNEVDIKHIIETEAKVK